MASAALLMLQKEVAVLRALPAGPQRKADCARPRRRFWDTIASIQVSLTVVDTSSGRPSDWQLDRAREARECCTELMEVLAILEACERENCESHWASTEYSALGAEISRQLAGSERVLGLPGADAADGLPGEQPRLEEEERSALASTVASASDLGSADSLDPARCIGPSCGHYEPRPSSKPAGHGGQARAPVRLRAADLGGLSASEDEMDHCKHFTAGICKMGCSVGGCQGAMVEAW
mmetsp:Transcript_22550/g.59539  ORF Transcript_22550/g.59539 Transcript_22550/m.59539 type:complete len:237 (-) Transcript_22550:170-880(-)